MAQGLLTTNLSQLLLFGLLLNGPQVCWLQGFQSTRTLPTVAWLQRQVAGVAQTKVGIMAVGGNQPTN